MILTPYSYNGTLLDSTDYATSIPRASANLQLMTNPAYIRRAGAVPVFSGKEFQPVTLNLEVIMQWDFMEQFEDLNQLFDTKDETPRQFICTDNGDTDSQWYVYATAKQVQGGHDGPMAVVTLAFDDPIWQSVTQNSSTWSTTSTTSTTDVTVAGNDYSYPSFEITPTSQPSTDYLYNMYVQVLPTSTLPYPARFLDITGTTDTTWDTAALVTAGKMQADGDDLRVFRDGVEVDRWLNGINTTDTHVIVAADMPAGGEMVLGTAIASSDTATEISLYNGPVNRERISALPNSGRLILSASLGSTDTEEFTYVAKTVTATKLAFTVGTRAARGTTATSHAVGHFARFLPYDFNIVYGNASSTAPETDDTRKPLQALTSRNNSFTWTNFSELAGTRPGAFVRGVYQVSDPTSSRSGFYTSTDDAGDTDPATAIGLAAYTYEKLGAWKSDTIALTWDGYIPDGISSVVASGAQTQTSANTPASMFFRLAAVYGTYTTSFVVSPQTSTDYGTWTTWSKASTDSTVVSGAKYTRWAMVGTQLGSTDEHSKIEISSLTLGITNPPHVMLRSEASNNKLDCTITNTTTGESIEVVYPLPINGTLTIDTDPDFPTAKYNGQIVNGAVLLSSIRAAWLKLQPGSNTLTFDNNLGANSDITIVIKWRDRFNFL